MDESAQLSAEFNALSGQQGDILTDHQRCRGISGEIHGNNHSPFSIFTSWKKRGRLKKKEFKYTGLGIALRNDGRVYAVQIFCSVKWLSKEGGNWHRQYDPIRNAIVDAEQTKRDLLGYPELVVDLYLEEIVQIRAHIFAKYGSLSRNPLDYVDCESYKEIAMIGENIDDLLWNLFQEHDHIVVEKEWAQTGVGVARSHKGTIYVLQIFCS